jgi:hypothetical protein
MSDVIPPPPPEIPPDQEIPASPSIVPAPEPRKRSPILIVGIVVGVIVLLGAAGFFALRSKGDGTYTANGVAFQYPGSWVHGPSTLVAQRGTSVWSETFGPTDGPSSVIVTQYTLNTDISQISAAAAQREVTDLVRGLAQGAGGELTSEATPTTIGMLNGYQVSFTAQVNGTPVDIELTTLFHGTAQYNINCQHTDAEAAEIAQGCAQVKSTFALTGESPAP